MLREAEIDIAIDLMGPTQGARPAIFVVPAGANSGDLPRLRRQQRRSLYRLRHSPTALLFPESERDLYREKIVYLPDSFMGTDSKRPISSDTPSRSEEGLPESGFVFGAFSNSYKVSPQVFDVWMDLLRDDQRQRALAFSTRREGHGQFASRGAVARCRSGAARFRSPCRAQSRSSGAPSIGRFVSRYGAPWSPFDGLRHALGRHAGAHVYRATFRRARCDEPSLGARPYRAYCRRVAELQGMRAASLPGTRKCLPRSGRGLPLIATSFPLFNTQRFTLHIEAAYTAMWERHQQGDPPASISVPALPDADRTPVRS